MLPNTYIRKQEKSQNKLPFEKLWRREAKSKVEMQFEEQKSSRMPAAHTCNPCYSGDTDQEDRGLKPAWANSSWDTISKNNHHKNRAGGVAQGEGPEFKFQNPEKKPMKLRTEKQ
jgi:hypothetical protein